MESVATKNIPAIGDVIRQLGILGILGGVRRVPRAYSMETSLSIIEAIGRQRSPRFVIDDENRFAYEQMIKWCHADPDMKSIDPATRMPMPGDVNKGLYIAGNTGTGKSWALEIIRAYCLVNRFAIRYAANKDSVLGWRNIRVDEICDTFTRNGVMQQFKTAQCIGIQDLGAEPEESVYMGNRQNVLRQLIEYRGDRSDVMTLFTSNLPINHKSLVSRYGDRVASRLSEMCNYLEMTGKDRRKM